MHTVLVVGGWSYNQLDRDEKEMQRAFIQNIVGEDVYCYAAFMDDICYTIGPGYFHAYDTRNNIDLDGIDIVFIRGMQRVDVSAAYHLSKYCAWVKKPCVTEYTSYTPADKVAQTILFLEHDVNFLKTLYIPDSMRLTDKAEETFGYPYILKATLGTHGHDNYLIHSRQEAERVIAKSPGIDFLTQEFCPNEFDYRLLIVGKNQLLFERRSEDQSHLNNTSRGGRATLATSDLPAKIVKQSRGLAQELGLMLAGIDIIPHKETGELYFLEVNLQPQLRTGAFQSEKKELLRKLFEDLYP